MITLKQIHNIPRIGHYLSMGIIILPASILNYAVIFYAVPILIETGHTLTWISPVIIMDTICFIINGEMFRRYYPK